MLQEKISLFESSRRASVRCHRRLLLWRECGAVVEQRPPRTPELVEAGDRAHLGRTQGAAGRVEILLQGKVRGRSIANQDFGFTLATKIVVQENFRPIRRRDSVCPSGISHS